MEWSPMAGLVIIQSGGLAFFLLGCPSLAHEWVLLNPGATGLTGEKNLVCLQTKTWPFQRAELDCACEPTEGSSALLLMAKKSKIIVRARVCLNNSTRCPQMHGKPSASASQVFALWRRVITSTQKIFFKVLNTRENNEDKWSREGSCSGWVDLQLGDLGGTSITWHTLGQDRAVSGEKENTMATWGRKDKPSYEKLQNTRFWKEGWCWDRNQEIFWCPLKLEEQNWRLTPSLKLLAGDSAQSLFKFSLGSCLWWA